MDPNEPFAVINPERITFLRQLVKGARKFVEQVYIPDVLAIAPFYKDWFSRGEGLGNFLSYGDYSSGNREGPQDVPVPARRGPRPRSRPRSIRWIRRKITESVSHSWYEYSDGDGNGKHPSQGETNPKYTGPKPPYDHLDVDKKYSWLKTPRYDGKPMEVGPLARMVVGYAVGPEGDPGGGRRRAEGAERAARGAVLDARPDRGARARIAD